MIADFLRPVATLAGAWSGRVKERIRSILERRRVWKNVQWPFFNLVVNGRLEQAKEAPEDVRNTDPKQQGEVALWLGCRGSSLWLVYVTWLAAYATGGWWCCRTVQ